MTSPAPTPMTAFERTALIAAAKAGDSSAFHQLATEIRPRLVRIALRKTQSYAEAEDLVQETLIKAWRALPSFREQALFTTWTTRILLNEFHQSRRKADYRHLDYTDDLAAIEQIRWHPHLAAADDSLDEQLAGAQLISRMLDAIEKLPVSMGRVLRMSFIEEQSCETIAATLSISIAAVKSRRHRGKLELLRRFSNQLRLRAG